MRSDFFNANGNFWRWDDKQISRFCFLLTMRNPPHVFRYYDLAFDLNGWVFPPLPGWCGFQMKRELTLTEEKGKGNDIYVYRVPRRAGIGGEEICGLVFISFVDARRRSMTLGLYSLVMYCACLWHNVHVPYWVLLMSFCAQPWTSWRVLVDLHRWCHVATFLHNVILKQNLNCRNVMCNTHWWFQRSFCLASFLFCSFFSHLSNHIHFFFLSRALSCFWVQFCFPLLSFFILLHSILCSGSFCFPLLYPCILSHIFSFQTNLIRFFFVFCLIFG